MLAAPSIEVRRARMTMMLGEIKSRTPNAIAYLERERGLA